MIRHTEHKQKINDKWIGKGKENSHSRIQSIALSTTRNRCNNEEIMQVQRTTVGVGHGKKKKNRVSVVVEKEVK